MLISGNRNVLLFMLATTVLLMAFNRPAADSHVYQSTLISLTACSAIIFFFFERKRCGQLWASVSFMFFLSYSIVNFNIPILRLFGIEVTSSVHTFIWTNQDIYNLSVATSALGLVFFFFAVSLAQSERKPPAVPNVGFIYTYGNLPIYAFGFLVLFLASSGTFVLGDYTATNASIFSSYFYKLFRLSLTALVIVKVTNFYSQKHDINNFRKYLIHLGSPLLLTLFPFLIISFIAGDRGPIIYFLLLTFGPFLAMRCSIGIGKAMLLGYSTAFFLSILGAARQARFVGGGFIERLTDQFTSTSWLYHVSYRFDEPVLLGSTLELGASVRTLNHVIANVPSNYDFGFGTFSFQQIASLIPGLGRAINVLFFDGDWKMDGSSNFITFLIQGPYPAYGDGTSVAAELYLDFGIFGVIIGLFLFGFFVGRYEHKLFYGVSRIEFSWICILMFFANSIYLARSSLFLDLSNMVLVYLLIMLCTKRKSLEGCGRAGF